MYLYTKMTPTCTAHIVCGIARAASILGGGWRGKLVFFLWNDLPPTCFQGFDATYQYPGEVPPILKGLERFSPSCISRAADDREGVAFVIFT
jgi:hypothetical protein